MSLPLVGARFPANGATNAVASGLTVSAYANFLLMLDSNGLIPQAFVPIGVAGGAFLPGVTALTGTDATALNYAVPAGLTPPVLFLFSPPFPISAINLPKDGLAGYKLRAWQAGDVVDNVTVIQPLNYSSSFVLVKTF